MSEIKRLQVNHRMSQAVIHGQTVYLAGQVATEAVGGSVTDQTREILARADVLLEEAGSHNDRLLSATIWLTDISYFDEMNAVWDTWLAAGPKPARACVEAKLAAPGWKVEIAFIAALR